MLFSYGCGQQQINDNEKCRQIAGNFDSHADAAVQRGVHCPMEHIQATLGATVCRHWVSGKCQCRVAPAAAMVHEFIETHTNH